MIHAVQTFGLILVELLVLFSLISVLVALVNRRFGPDRIQSWMADGRLPGPLKGLLLGRSRRSVPVRRCRCWLGC